MYVLLCTFNSIQSSAVVVSWDNIIFEIVLHYIIHLLIKLTSVFQVPFYYALLLYFNVYVLLCGNTALKQNTVTFPRPAVHMNFCRMQQSRCLRVNASQLP
jgi:hypothetical protein